MRGIHVYWHRMGSRENIRHRRHCAAALLLLLFVRIASHGPCSSSRPVSWRSLFIRSLSWRPLSRGPLDRLPLTLHLCSLLLVLFLLPARAVSQVSPQLPGIPGRVSLDLVLALADSAIQLPNQFVIEGSDSVLVGEDRLLTRDREYTIDYRLGRIRLDSALVRSLIRERTNVPED